MNSRFYNDDRFIICIEKGDIDLYDYAVIRSQLFDPFSQNELI